MLALASGRSRKRRFRWAFRCLRITLLLLLFLGICAFLWLNQRGLPAFLREPVLGQLRAQGLEVGVTRLRLRGYQTIVAEDVRLEQKAAGLAPRVAARQLVIHTQLGALLRGQVRLRGAVLEEGTLWLPLLASNVPPREVVVTRLHAQMDFHSQQRWQLSALEGHCLGIDFRLSGTISNASALLTWKAADSAAAQRQARFWNEVVASLEQIRFTPTAKLKGTFAADAKLPETSSAAVQFTAAHLASPWANGRDLDLSLTARPCSATSARLELTLATRGAQIRWGQAAVLKLTGQTDIPFAAFEPQNLRLNLQADSLASLWARASRLQLEAKAASLSAPGWAKDSHFALKAESVQSRWGEGAELQLQGSLQTETGNSALAQGWCDLRGRDWRSVWLDTPEAHLSVRTAQWTSNLWPTTTSLRLESQQPHLKLTNFSSSAFAALGQGNALGGVPRPPDRPLPGTLGLGRARFARLDTLLRLPAPQELQLGNSNVSWLSRLEKAGLEAQGDLQSLQMARLEADRLTFSANWRAPVITLTAAQGMLDGAPIMATGRLDVVTRELVASLTSEVDPHRLAPLFLTNASSWQSEYVWEHPPRVQVGLRMIMPAWTNRSPDRWREAFATLALHGWGQSDLAVVRGVGIASAKASVFLGNQLWQIRDVEILRPEGALQLNLDLDGRTGQYHGAFRSGVDPKSLRSLFGTAEVQTALNYFQFTGPPLLEGEARGRWNDWARTGLRAHVVLTNFAFRNQAIRSCVADLQYTNHVLDFHQVQLQRAEGAASADLVRVDLRRQAVCLTNLNSAIEVGAFAAAVGPHIVKTLEPYQFGEPPRVHFQGVVGIRNRSGLDDARFEVTGGPFQWQNFHLSRVAARLHWLGDTLSISNFQGTLHGGEMIGGARFDNSHPGMEFSFRLTVTNINSQLLLADLFPASTNRLEGLLGGQLVVARANTTNQMSWQGYGDASLRDGLIWNVPLFRFVSPILNSVSPGLGNSRARQATASFLITNSVIATRDLEVHASATRLLFDGTVDFEGRVRGKMEAELLRDTPGLGWIISHAFWPVTKLFVYKISGTLSHPKYEPSYIPKVLLAPFHPLRTLKELFSEDKPEEPAPDPKK
jgi:hypothetical protein